MSQKSIADFYRIIKKRMGYKEQDLPQCCAKCKFCDQMTGHCKLNPAIVLAVAPEAICSFYEPKAKPPENDEDVQWEDQVPM